MRELKGRVGALLAELIDSNDDNLIVSWRGADTASAHVERTILLIAPFGGDRESIVRLLKRERARSPKLG